MSIRSRLAAWLAPELADQIAPPLILDERMGYDGQEYSFGEYPDHNSDLDTFAKRVAKYEEMRVGHAAIVAQFEALLEPILAGTWTLDRGPGLPLELAAEEDEQAAETAAELMRSNLLRTSALREYRMQTPWKQFLGELFTAQEFGFSLFERSHRIQDGPLGTLAVYDKLTWVHPKSLKYLHVGEGGEFLGVTQDWTSSGYYDAEGNWHTRQPPEGNAGRWGGTFIPAERLFVHSRRKEGDRVEGRPMSRAMYGAYKRRTFFERAQVIDAQKRAIGIPWYKMSKDTPKENREFALKQVKGMRAGNERQVVVTQGDDEIGYIDMQANAVPLDGYIRATGNDIRGAAGTMFMGLGQDGQGGTQSLAATMEPHFNLHIQAVADGMREAVQLGLIEPLHEINFADLTPPELRVEDVTPPDLDPIVKAKGTDLLGPWRGVDAQSVRERLKLAPLSEEELEQMDEMAATMRERLLNGTVDEQGRPIPATDEEMEDGEEGDGDKPQRKGNPRDADKDAPNKSADEGNDEPADMAELGELARAAGLKRETWREPTEREARYLRLGEIDDTLTRHQESFTRRMRRVWDELAEDVTAKLSVKDGEVKLSGRLKRAGAERVMRAAALSVRSDGNALAVDEIRRQVADHESGAALADFSPGAGADKASSGGNVISLASVRRRIDGELETAITLDLDAMLTTLEQSARRGYLDALREGLEGAAARDAVTTALQGRSDALFVRIGRDLGSRAFNGGRAEAVADFREQSDAGGSGLTVDVAVRSEVLDGRTCGPCLSLDGQTAEVDSQDYWALQPPNGCDGGSYCRGFMDFIVVEKAA